MSRIIRKKIRSSKAWAEALMPKIGNSLTTIKVMIIRPNQAPKANMALWPSRIQKRAFCIRPSHSCLDSVSTDITRY